MKSPVSSDSIAPTHTLSYLASIAAAALSPLNKLTQVSSNTDKVNEIFYQASLFYTTENLSKEKNTATRLAFIEKARTILKEFDNNKRVYDEVAPTIHEPIIDSSAASLLQMCEEMFHNWQPIQILGDGNCLFNAVAMYIAGKHNSELSRKLRLAVACELLFRGDLYCKYLEEYCHSSDSQFIEREISEEIKNCLRPGNWCGFISISTLPTILNRPVRVVFPVRSSVMYSSQIINRTFVPLENNQRTDTMHILCCGNEHKFIQSQEIWIPNHYSLLLPPSCFQLPTAIILGTASLARHQISSSSVCSSHSSHLSCASRTLFPDEEITDLHLSLPKGARALLNKQAFNTQQLYELLSNSKIRIDAVKTIPSCKKENCYFIVNIGIALTEYDNYNRNRLRLQDALKDNTGPWDHQSSTNVDRFKLSNDGTTLSWVPSSKKEFDLRLHRANYMDKGTTDNDVSANKFVLWFFNAPFSPSPGYAVVGYFGSAYKSRPHGNARNTTTPYMRTSHQTIAAMMEHHESTAGKTYRSLLNTSSPPRSRQQIADAQYRRRKELGLNSRSIQFNFAAELQEALDLFGIEPIIQYAERTVNGPRIVLSKPEQYMQIVRFCNRQMGDSTILGIDRTFNLSCCFVTITVFKQLDLYRRRTQDAPIFLGPMLLSAEASEETYCYFLQKIRLGLQNHSLYGISFNEENFAFGSDQERALTNAMKSVFPNSARFLCVYHISKNIDERLRKHGVLYKNINTIQ